MSTKKTNLNKKIKANKVRTSRLTRFKANYTLQRTHTLLISNFKAIIGLTPYTQGKNPAIFAGFYHSAELIKLPLISHSISNTGKRLTAILTT